MKTGLKTKKSLGIKIVIALIVMMPAFALTDIGFDSKDTALIVVGLLIFILDNIAITPIAVSSVRNDMKDWENAFYNSTLAKSKETEDYYLVETPLPFERKMFCAVLCWRLLGTIFIALCLFLLVRFGPIQYKLLHSDNIKGVLANDSYRLYKARNAASCAKLILYFVSPFILSIFAYLIAITICELKVISDHKYIAYRAIVNCVDSNGIKVSHDEMCYIAKDYTLIGVRKNQLNFTPVTFVFIPDDVLVLPDI
jgi:hypothetical protein